MYLQLSSQNLPRETEENTEKMWAIVFFFERTDFE